MSNSCAVCSLAVTLCLVVCVCASEKVSEADTKAAVEEAKESVKNVRERAQNERSKANLLLERVESSKRNAEEAALKSQKAPKENTQAGEVANTIKRLSDEVDNLYQDAKQKMDNAVKSLTAMMSDAQKLDDGSNIQVPPNTDSTTDYTDPNNKAKALKAEAEALNNNITEALKLFADVDATANNMEQKATEAQLKDSHVSAIVALAKIETMLGNANTIIPQIEGKRSEVSGIVDKMKTLQTNPPVVSDENINALHQSAANALNAATGAVTNANNAKAAIQTQKDCTTAALTKVEAEGVDVSNAYKEVQKAEECVAAAEKIVPQLQNKLIIADNSVKAANASKEKLQAALSTATRSTRTEHSLTQSQVKALQDSVSADVKTIQTMMEEAVSNLQETENHKKTVHDILQEIKNQCTTELTQSNQIFKEQCQSATKALTTVKDAVEKAQNAVSAMKEQKSLADTALENVQKTDNNVIKAEEEANAANTCVATAQQNVVQLNNALKTAKASVTKANDAKQEIKTAMSKATSEERTKQTQEKEEENLSVADGTVPDQKDATIQPKITNTEQPTSKESPDQSNNSGEKLKDELKKGAQNVSTTALTGGKAPAPGANNDSAMTVSVPLLVALIASAVLQ